MGYSGSGGRRHNLFQWHCLDQISQGNSGTGLDNERRSYSTRMENALAKDLTDFLWKYCTYRHAHKTKSQLLDEVTLHLKYKTIVCLEDEKGLVGVCRFNIIDLVEATIFDAAIRPDKRNKSVLQELLILGLKLYPNIKQVRFESANKDESFVTPVSLILKKESCNGKK